MSGALATMFMGLRRRFAGYVLWRGIPRRSGGSIQDRDVVEAVNRFLSERCQRDQSFRQSVTQLYADFDAWAAQRQHVRISMMRFSLSLEQLGVRKVKASTMYALGIKLKGRA